MTQYKRIAIDTCEAVFTLHGIDWEDGNRNQAASPQPLSPARLAARYRTARASAR